MPQVGYAHRQAPMGREGMVATCHPLASLAGVETLKGGDYMRLWINKGGNHYLVHFPA